MIIKLCYICTSEIKNVQIMKATLIMISNLFSLNVETFNTYGVFHSLIVSTDCLPYMFISSIGEELGLVPISISALDTNRFKIIFKS